ncbi:hypothetical protein U91I_02788 [alpha proteobacterium U9-1i]|nr:hypothetical protein U91I_02788 [alpha proteobacterium U9-1i]
MTSFTYQDLMLMAAGNRPREIVVKLMFASDYSSFVESVEDAIDHIADRMSENPQLRQEREEDELSIDIVDQLKAMSFDAEHDMTIGGHGDIVVRGRGSFLWIGEAKKHSSYPWLLKGYNQLTTRYASGLETQAVGGLIVYSYGQRVDQVMENWKTFLDENATVEGFGEGGRSACFRSTYLSERTGILCTVRHLGISLYFDPKDRA